VLAEAADVKGIDWESPEAIGTDCGLQPEAIRSYWNQSQPEATGSIRAPIVAKKKKARSHWNSVVGRGQK